MSDMYGKTYEFVSKNEAKPVKEVLESIIRKLQGAMRKYGVTFQFTLVGSAGRNLITKVSGGNTGFDFDYNLVLQKCTIESAKKLRELFVNEINKILINYNYKNAENNTQAITIKMIDQKNSRIIHSCDFAIVNEYFDGDDYYQEILIRNKDNNQYTWNKRPFGKNYGLKLSDITANGLWTELKDEYLKLKNKNMDPDKKSFALYFEAINNVYNRYDWS